MATAFSTLLSVAEADRLLAACAEEPGVKRPAEAVPLEAAAGRVLREDLRADRAYPAQDRSYMDGIAIRYADLSTHEDSGVATVFTVAGVARAGDARLSLATLTRASASPTSSASSSGSPASSGRPGSSDPTAWSASSAAETFCVEIMTGAAVPAGCDTVIRYEDLVLEDGVATVRPGVAVTPRGNVHFEGSDCAAGAVLVPAGTRLTAAHIAIAASVGMPTVSVARRPRVAVVATGDELVGVDETPLAHQLRVSNAHGLAALLAPHADTRVHRVGDDPAALSGVLRAVLSSFDMVLVSGGVSAGKFDLVPDTLETLGVRKVFHKLAQKPGKPLWFGMMPSPQTPLPLASVAEEGLVALAIPGGPHGPPLSPGGTSDEASSGERVLPPEPARVVPVFGLPGNPVSALVCARRFVLPFLERMLGANEMAGARVSLGSETTPLSRLTRYLPVKLVTRVMMGAEAGVSSGFETVAEPRTVNGSGDFATLGASDGFVELPPSEKHYPAGAQMAFFGWST